MGYDGVTLRESVDFVWQKNETTGAVESPVVTHFFEKFSIKLSRDQRVFLHGGIWWYEFFAFFFK